MDSVIKAISTIAAQSHLDQSVLVIGSSRPARPLTQTIKQKKTVATIKGGNNFIHMISECKITQYKRIWWEWRRNRSLPGCGAKPPLRRKAAGSSRTLPAPELPECGLAGSKRRSGRAATWRRQSVRFDSSGSPGPRLPARTSGLGPFRSRASATWAGRFPPTGGLFRPGRERSDSDFPGCPPREHDS